MKSRTFIVGVAAALALSACAGLPRGPALTYEQLLPNTHENPAWARNALPARTPAAQNPDASRGENAPR